MILNYYVHTYMYSLACQPLLLKERKGLVNNVPSACPRGTYMTSSNVTSLTTNSYAVSSCACARMYNNDTRFILLSRIFDSGKMSVADSFCLIRGQAVAANDQRVLRNEASSYVRIMWQRLLDDKLKQKSLEWMWHQMKSPLAV